YFRLKAEATCANDLKAEATRANDDYKRLGPPITSALRLSLQEPRANSQKPTANRRQPEADSQKLFAFPPRRRPCVFKDDAAGLEILADAIGFGKVAGQPCRAAGSDQLL